MVVKIKLKNRRYKINTFAVVFVISFIIAALIACQSYFTYRDTPYLHTYMFLAALCFVVPVGGYFYYKYILLQNKERHFPQFLKDLADGVRAGLSLPQAVINVSKINYGALTEDVKKLANHISWGVPFDEALRRFAERTGSKMIKMSVDLITEAYLAGGNVADILDTVAEDAGKIYTMREERKTKFSGFVGTIYAVYIIFLIIVVVLLGNLLPEIPTVPNFGTQSQSTPFGPVGGIMNTSPQQPISENDLATILFNLAIIEAVFAGLLAGIAGEGSTMAGVKHAIILTFIGITVFQIFVPVPDPRDRLARAIAKMPANVEASVAVGMFFVEENITTKDISQHVKKYAEKMNIPAKDMSGAIRFRQDLKGCEPCVEGVVEVHPNIIIVRAPTYLNFSVKTDVDKGVYVVYVS